MRNETDCWSGKNFLIAVCGQLASQINVDFNHSVNANRPEVREVIFRSSQKPGRQRPGNRVTCTQTWGAAQTGCEAGHAQTWMSGFWLVLSSNYQLRHSGLLPGGTDKCSAWPSSRSEGWGIGSCFVLIVTNLFPCVCLSSSVCGGVMDVWRMTINYNPQPLRTLHCPPCVLKQDLSVA